VFGFFMLDCNVLLGDDESSPWAMQQNYWFKKRGMLSPFHGLVCMSNELWRKNQVKIRTCVPSLPETGYFVRGVFFRESEN
jgi:hypothetical protein